MSNIEDLIALGSMRKVHTFEYGGKTLHYRGLSYSERDEFLQKVKSGESKSSSDNLFIAKSLCNSDGSPRFKTEEEVEAAILAIASFDPIEVLKPLLEKAMAASGIGKTTEDAIAKK